MKLCLLALLFARPQSVNAFRQSYGVAADEDMRTSVADLKGKRDVCCCDQNECHFVKPSRLGGIVGNSCGLFADMTEKPTGQCFRALDMRWRALTVNSEVNGAVRHLAGCKRGAVLIEGKMDKRHMRGAQKWREYLAEQGYGSGCIVVLADPKDPEQASAELRIHSTASNIVSLAAGLRAELQWREKIHDELAADRRLVHHRIPHLVVIFIDHGVPGELVLRQERINRTDWLNAVSNFHTASDKLLVYVSACYSGSMFSSTTLLDADELLKGFDAVGKMTGDLISLKKEVHQVMADSGVPIATLTSFLRNLHMGLALCRMGKEEYERNEIDSELKRLRSAVQQGENVDIESVGVSLLRFLANASKVTASKEFLSKMYPCGLFGEQPMHKCIAADDDMIYATRRLKLADLQCSGRQTTTADETGDPLAMILKPRQRTTAEDTLLAKLVFAIVLAQRQPEVAPGEFALDDKVALICQDRPNSCLAFASSLPSYTSKGKDASLGGSYFFKAVILDLARNGGNVDAAGRFREHIRRVQAKRLYHHEETMVSLSRDGTLPTVKYRDIATGIAMSRPGGHFDLYQPVAFGNGADMSIGEFFPQQIDAFKRWGILEFW